METFDTDILLATYNGEKYLRDLLESLDRQTDQNWRLLARDDGSSDRSVSILEEWGREKGDRFVLLEEGPKGLGATANFNALLEASDARYFLPCDQDDVWLEDKVERLRAAIADEEARLGADTPLIVHTDLIVVDEHLQRLGDSFWEYQLIRMLPAHDPWKLMTLQNVVTGCAMIGNAALLQAALPVPADAMVHDWWLAMVCALKGRIVRLNDSTVLYRQHSSNSLGAQKWSAWLAFKLVVFEPRRALDRPREILDETRVQATAVLRRFEGDLAGDQADFIRSYANLRRAGFFRRKVFGLRHGLWYRGAVKTSVFYAAL